MNYLPKDHAILVSSVNMLLRDEEYDSLESLCYVFCREPKEIKDYNGDKRHWISIQQNFDLFDEEQAGLVRKPYEIVKSTKR